MKPQKFLSFMISPISSKGLNLIWVMTVSIGILRLKFNFLTKAAFPAPECLLGQILLCLVANRRKAQPGSSIVSTVNELKCPQIEKSTIKLSSNDNFCFFSGWIKINLLILCSFCLSKMNNYLNTN